MADNIKVITNLPDFKASLRALGERLERRIIVQGLTAAGNVLRDEARRLAPVLKPPGRKGRIPGALKRAIRVASSRKSRKGRPIRTVGVRATNAQKGKGADPFYWRFLEGGWIPRGRGNAFKGGKRARALGRRRAISGGARRVAYPFLKPAFDAKGPAALEALTRRVSQGIARENTKRK